MKITLFCPHTEYLFLTFNNVDFLKSSAVNDTSDIDVRVRTRVCVCVCVHVCVHLNMLKS